MKCMPLASRTAKEISREPISALLGLALPLLLLTVFSLLGRSMPVSMFHLENFAPGIIIFGYSFLTMFSALLIAQDEKSSFLSRLFASPLKASDYILAYALPLVPIALVQTAVCFMVAGFLGLAPSVRMLYSTVVLLPQAFMSIAAGLLMGTLFNEKQVQGIGNIYIIMGSLLGGTWMDLSMIGGVWRDISYAFPFAHSLDAARVALNGNGSLIVGHLLWPLSYGLVIFAAAVFAFARKMKSVSV